MTQVYLDFKYQMALHPFYHISIFSLSQNSNSGATFSTPFKIAAHQKLPKSYIDSHFLFKQLWQFYSILMGTLQVPQVKSTKPLTAFTKDFYRTIRNVGSDSMSL
jgi:hypothetical protein